MYKNSSNLIVLCAIMTLAFVLTGCATNSISFIRLKSINRMCKTQECVTHKATVPPHRITMDTESNVTTWAWDTDVLRERHADKAAGAPYWYEGYYMDCTYEVDFDPEGNKIDARWIGAGCFNSRGELYRPSFFYDE